jgi:hypothetical protein
MDWCAWQRVTKLYIARSICVLHHHCSIGSTLQKLQMLATTRTMNGREYDTLRRRTYCSDKFGVTDILVLVRTSVCQSEQPIDEVCWCRTMGAPFQASQNLQLHFADVIRGILGEPHIRSDLSPEIASEVDLHEITI